MGPAVFSLFGTCSTLRFGKPAAAWSFSMQLRVFYVSCSAAGCKLSSNMVRNSRSSRLFPPDK